MSVHQRVKLGLKRDVAISGIIVKPSVLSAVHEFSFEGLPCKLGLPPRPKFRKDLREIDGVRPYSYGNSGNRTIPFSFVVTRVTLTIDLKTTVQFHLDKVKNQRGETYFRQGFTAGNEKKILSLSDKTEDLADRALNYWISIIRWKCNHPLLTEESSKETGLSIRQPMMDLTTGTPLHLGSRIRINVNRVDPITRSMWKKVQLSLSCSEQIPLWMLYLRDANLRFVKSDYRSAVLFLAVACESILRHFTSDILENPLCQQQQKCLEKLGVQYLTDSWDKFEILRRHKLEINKGAMNSLFKIRNDIMHRGIYEETMIKEKWKDIYNAVFKIVEDGQKIIDRTLAES